METLNHIIIYNLVFSLVNNCCICNPCCMTNNVEMPTLCRNLSFGLATKAKGLQGCGSRGSPRAKAKRP